MSDIEAIEAEIIEAIGESGDLIISPKNLPTIIHILPLFDRPFFPAQAFPIMMEEEPWFETLDEIAESPHHMVGLLLVNGEPGDELTPDKFSKVGSLVQLHNPSRSDGKMQFIAEGIERFKVTKWLSKKPPYKVKVSYPKLGKRTHTDEMRAYAMAIINTLRDLMQLNPLYAEELKYFLNRFSPNDPSPLADFAVGLTSASGEDLQQVLELFSLVPRMKKVLLLLKKELNVAKIQSKIRERVEERIDEQQRKFFLREQLKEIQKELGIEKDDRTAEIERFQKRLKSLTLTDEAKSQVDDEFQKLSMLEIGSPEYTVTRNYLDWITILPWGKSSHDRLDLRRAKKILNEDHDGLDEVKERILEFLAIGKLKDQISGSIILLVGPPGVGKTSIGRSIARTLGREFYRFSLGGMRDEAEIKGHRRTYIGAMPGKIIQALKSCGTDNPVIMLDEIDKVGASYRGDPASALLEVLDPEQNVDFLDHYLDLRFDLSKTLFICTANQLDTIPGALLDRMELIQLSGYIAEEKLAIAKNHLWPRQLERNGVKKSQLKITDQAILKVIEGYAREAGVRNLEKQLGRIIRKTGRKLAEGKKGPIRVGPKVLTDYLGKPYFAEEELISGVGVVTGLAWTSMGGATLSIEATKVHGKSRGFKMTGQLGDVMKESTEIAYSYIASHLESYGADADYFDEAFIHLHVPEGATPKDGPSAGVTMATALLSLASNRKIDRPLAMTGELTLTGNVFPVGGIREKVIAARRVGITELIIPADNKGDFEDLPPHIRKGIKIHYAKHYRDVKKIVFG